MSKLLEKLDRVSEGRNQPIGFGAATAREKRVPMVVIASVPAGNADPAGAAARAGADALLIAMGQPDNRQQALMQLKGANFDIPWGVALDSPTREELGQLADMGCDFAVFTAAATPASVLGEERMGKVLQVEASLSPELAKAIGRLSIDAVLLSPAGERGAPLTLQQLMVYERLASGAGKHILASLPGGLPLDDLESWWELGARGMVVDLEVDDPARRLSELQEALQKLPTTRKKPRSRISATIPLPGPVSEAEAPGEDDDEDD